MREAVALRRGGKSSFAGRHLDIIKPTALQRRGHRPPIGWKPVVPSQPSSSNGCGPVRGSNDHARHHYARDLGASVGSRRCADPVLAAVPELARDNVRLSRRAAAHRQDRQWLQFDGRPEWQVLDRYAEREAVNKDRSPRLDPADKQVWIRHVELCRQSLARQVQRSRRGTAASRKPSTARGSLIIEEQAAPGRAPIKAKRRKP
jgi:hypothetical protein